MSDYAPLLEALEGHFDKQLAELPAALRKRVQADCPMPWDSMSPEQRRNMASQWDYQHDPAVGEKLQSLLSCYGVTEPAHLTLQDSLQRKATLLREITEVMNDPSLPDVTRNSQLEDLRSEHQGLKERQARGDFHDPNEKRTARRSTKPPGYLNHDLEWQEMANQIATQKMTETGKRITRNDVAKILAESIGETVDTVLRRIRKEW